MACFARILSAPLFLLAGACGGGGSSAAGGGALDGAVHGQSIMIEDAVSASITFMVGSTQAHVAGIALSSTKDRCADAMSNTVHPNEKDVALLLGDVDGTTFNTPTAPGTYSIYQGYGTRPAKFASFAVSVFDATCHVVTAQEALSTSGTVTLSSVSGNRFSGSFDLVLDSGDHVTGSFDPEECPVLATRVNSTTPPSCM
jgi:hypothetical protein